jgi:hypothetical protein
MFLMDIKRSAGLPWLLAIALLGYGTSSLAQVLYFSLPSLCTPALQIIDTNDIGWARERISREQGNEQVSRGWL